MAKLRYVKLSKNWDVLAPIPTSTISQKLSTRRITGCGFGGKMGELSMDITLSDGSLIIIQPKHDGTTIGLIEIKY